MTLSPPQVFSVSLNHMAFLNLFHLKEFVHNGIRLCPSVGPVTPFIKAKYLIVTNPFPVFCKFTEVVALVLKVAHQVRHPDI